MKDTLPQRGVHVSCFVTGNACFTSHTCRNRFSRKSRERPLKRALNTALHLTHVRERKLAVPPFRLFRPPPLLSVSMAYRSPRTDLRRGVSQKKLAPEAYRALGGVARNSVASRAIVGHCGAIASPPPESYFFLVVGRLIFIHHQCWEVLPFCRFQHQRCIKSRVLRAQDFLHCRR